MASYKENVEASRTVQNLVKNLYFDGTGGRVGQTGGGIRLQPPNMIPYQPSHPFKIGLKGSYASGFSAYVQDGIRPEVAGRIWLFGAPNNGIIPEVPVASAFSAVPGVGASPVTAHLFVLGQLLNTNWATYTATVGMQMVSTNLCYVTARPTTLEFKYPLGRIEFPAVTPTTYPPPQVSPQYRCVPPRVVQYQTQDIYFNFGTGGGSTVTKCRLTGKTDDTTYTGDVYGNGTDVAPTETGVVIRVEGIAASATLRTGISFAAGKQRWAGVEQWTLTEVPRMV